MTAPFDGFNSWAEYDEAKRRQAEVAEHNRREDEFQRRQLTLAWFKEGKAYRTEKPTGRAAQRRLRQRTAATLRRGEG